MVDLENVDSVRAKAAETRLDRAADRRRHIVEFFFRLQPSLGREHDPLAIALKGAAQILL